MREKNIGTGGVTAMSGLGSKTVVATPQRDFRSTPPISGHRQTGAAGPVRASEAEVA